MPLLWNALIYIDIVAVADYNTLFSYRHNAWQSNNRYRRVLNWGGGGGQSEMDSDKFQENHWSVWHQHFF